MQSKTGEYKGKITNLAVIIRVAFNLLYLISPYDNNFPLHFFPHPVASSADRILIRIKKLELDMDTSKKARILKK